MYLHKMALKGQTAQGGAGSVTDWLACICIPLRSRHATRSVALGPLLAAYSDKLRNYQMAKEAVDARGIDWLPGS